MSYPKNAATPPRIAVGAVVQISDGAVQTSGVSIRVVPQGGSAAAGLGTTTYEDGIVLYAPTQAETNYDAFVVIAYKTGCIPATTTVVTSASDTAGYGGLDFSKIISATAAVNLSGTTIKTATDIETDTQDIQSRLPAALVGGRMDASVGAYQSGLTPLQPTVAGRTLDVSAGGEAGIDWANIGSPTTSVAFTNTTIASSQVVATVTNRVSANTDQWGGVTVTGMPMPTYTQPTGFLAATFPTTVASTTNITTIGAVSGSVGSISGVTFPANFGLLLIDSSGHVSLATAPLDASGTAAAVWGALLTSYTGTTTFGGRIMRTDSASAGNGAKVTGAGHVAADIHELQPAVIQATHFDLGAIDANALAADAASEVASAVRTNLATELARIDVASSTLSSQSSVNTLTTYVDTEVAAIKAKTDALPANPAATSDIPSAITIADAVLSRSVANVEGSAAEHTLCTLVLAALEGAISGNTWTIKRTNGSTTHYTKTVTADANASPIVSVQ